MRFGGHETFPLREGWLHKGIKLITESPEKFIADDVADWLGVGRNMAKSIRHWLQATGLAQPDFENRMGKRTPIMLTKLGKLIQDKDPYFLDMGTWWVLHANLVQSDTHGYSWYWFFNHFGFDRFDRALCLEHLRRAIDASRGNTPGDKTVERDLACLLSSYARVLPAPDIDPEEAQTSPFVELGLLSHFKGSGNYQLNRSAKPIPQHVFGYVVSSSFDKSDRVVGKTREISLRDLIHSPRSPGKVFLLGGEELFETLISYEAGPEHGLMEVVGHAGERLLRIADFSPNTWLSKHYSTASSRKKHAA